MVTKYQRALLSIIIEFWNSRLLNLHLFGVGRANKFIHDSIFFSAKEIVFLVPYRKKKMKST